MDFKLSFSKLYTVLFVALFSIGFQSSAEAQITIENATDCTIWVAATQLESNTAPLCDACNLTSLTRIVPSASITIPNNAACGLEYWKEVFYTTSPSGAHVASTANPSNMCGGDFGFAECGGTTIEINWSQTGAGSGVVTFK